MAVQLNIKLQGFDVLKQRLSALPGKLRRNIMRGGMRAAVAVIRGAVRNLVPVGRTGNLRRSIRVSTRAFRNGRIEGKVTAGGKLAYYANIVEGGAKPHQISVTRAAKALNLGGRVLVKKVQHPGFQGRRFMERAANQSEAAASNAFAQYVNNRVDLFLTAGRER